jgi:hypothetical protein
MLAKANAIILISCLSAHIMAEDDTDVKNMPPIALLEFLGQWTDEQGDDIDFEMLEDARFPETIDDRNDEKLRR